MKKCAVLIFIGVMIIFGCKLSFNHSSADNAQKKEIIDSAGRKVQIPYSPERIVAVNAYAGEMAALLGCEEKIVGMTKGKKFPPALDQKEKIGSFSTPSLEKIINLEPDLVFVYKSSLALDWLKQLEKAGIPLILMDFYKLDNFQSESILLGKILNKEKEVREYLEFVSGYEKIIKSRLSKIPLSRRKRVFVESYAAYSTNVKGGLSEIVEAAGGVNIASELNSNYTTVSSEWVVEKDPDFVVKALGNSTDYGYQISEDNLKEQWKQLLDRPGWNNIKAVKKNQVYVMGSDIWLGPHYIIGLSYMAKWFYPELFPDLEPDKIHAELLQRYYNLNLSGNWVYPVKTFNY
ncbi:MAG: ABC transporter substrate-binding protein [bacterium]